MEDDYIGKKCDYFNQFVKFAISDLKNNGVCYAYHIDQVKEIKKIIKDNIIVEETEYGFTLRMPRKNRKETKNETM